jgi:SAM-dependent methyltransferase
MVGEALRPPCVMCGDQSGRVVARFTSPPAGENRFAVDRYDRELWECFRCGHITNRHNMELSAIYRGAYVDVAYGSKMREAFDRVMALPDDRSDNRQRVRHVNSYASTHEWVRPWQVLDVGSGLGTFPAAMRETGWVVTAVDPDPRAAKQIADRAQVRTYCAGFLDFNLPERFQLVAFNKVLEHVPDPVSLLVHAIDFLTGDGVVYVELPDGEAALEVGPDREEFFVEHHGAFSVASTALLARQAGLRPLGIERVHEPSGKFTIRTFLQPTKGSKLPADADETARE